MQGMSVEREVSDSDTQALTATAEKAPLEEYATGPEKPAKMECCKFRYDEEPAVWAMGVG